MWRPQPGPQTEAFYCEADELFYGGAAGGGKSDLLLGLAISSHRKSLIFRREYPQIKDLESRSLAIVGDRGDYNITSKLWRLHDGRILEFGAVQHIKDARRYQGRPRDLLGFDEITHFAKPQYDFLKGWLRTTIKGQRCRVVCTGNPPMDPEGDWIVSYWAPWLDEQCKNPAKPGELRWFAMIDGKDTEVEGPKPIHFKGETIKPKSRTFIPAFLKDNPILAATDYESQLQSLPEPLRSQLLQGDFGAGQSDNRWQVIPTEWVKAAMARWENSPKPDARQEAIGVDVARGGECQTVLARRYRNWFAPLLKYPGQVTPDGPAVLGLILQAREPQSLVNVDVIGIGSSVYDLGRQAAISIYPMNGAAGSEATDRSGQLHFVNKRAEWYWRLREDLDPKSGMDLMIPPDRELLADLCAPRWKYTVRGIQVELKEDIVKRLGRSPDCGDAVVNAHATEGLAHPDVICSSITPASNQLSGFSGARVSGGGWN